MPSNHHCSAYQSRFARASLNTHLVAMSSPSNLRLGTYVSGLQWNVKHGVDEIHLQPISKRLAFGLTKVCRQIYAETASIPYALNRFILTRLMIFPYEDRLVYGIYPATVGEWMKDRLLAQLCTIKTVELPLIAWYNNHPLVELDIWASFPNLERLYVPTSYYCDLGGILERRGVCLRNFLNVIFVGE